MSRSTTFLSELRRRRVFRTGGLFLIAAWLVIQVASATAEPLGLPAWTTTFVVWVSVIGFPVALILGWRYEIGPQGISRTAPAAGETVDPSLRPSDYVILALAIAVIGGVTFSIVSRSTDAGDPFEIPQVDNTLQPTIAVLPFVTEATESADADLLNLIDGFVMSIRDQLNQIQALRTGARTSANAFRSATPRTPGEYVSIADQLRVQVLVDGYFFRGADDRFCASIDLIEGGSGLLRPGGSHMSCEDSISLLQQTVVARIAGALLPDDTEVLASISGATTEVSAKEAMLLADAIYNNVRDNELVDPVALDRAIALYRQVVREDPKYALGHARLGSALLYSGDAEGAFPSIIEAWLLDQGLSEVQTILGDYYFFDRDDRAGPSWKAAIDLNENNVDALRSYGLWLWLNWEITEPDQYYRRTVELDPLVLHRYADYGEYLGMSGYDDRALELADRVQEKFPDDTRGYRLIARLNELAGRLDHAIAWALRARQREPENEDLGDQIAELYARIGDYESMDRYASGPVLGLLFQRREYAQLIEVAEAIIEDPESTYEANSLYLLAFAHNATGDPDAAIFHLELSNVSYVARQKAHESMDLQALVHLIGAYAATGDLAEAEELADWFVKSAQRYIDTGGTRSWWPYIYLACANAAVGRDETALTQLEQLPGIPGLVIYPLLRDSICFDHLQTNERYRAVVDAIETRMAGYRERLPATLRAFGVEP